jgi:hypothetical protein
VRTLEYLSEHPHDPSIASRQLLSKESAPIFSPIEPAVEILRMEPSCGVARFA